MRTVIWEREDIFMNIFHFHASLYRVLNKHLPVNRHCRAQVTSILLYWWPIREGPLVPRTKIFVSRPLILNTESPAEEVLEVSGKANAFDSSPKKASDFQSCTFSPRNASDHNLYYWAPALTPLHSAHSTDFPGILWEEIIFWFPERPWNHASIKSQSVTVAVREQTQKSHQIGARTQSRQKCFFSFPFFAVFPGILFSNLCPKGPNF